MLPVTRSLVIANVAVFLLQMGGLPLMESFALWPPAAGPQFGPGFAPWQLVTYSFLHGGVGHIFFNMFGLYMFGSSIERLFGTRFYLAYYFASVVAAGLTHLAVTAWIGGPPVPVAVVINDAIAEVAISSGPLNLVNKELLRALNRALTALGERSDIRCLILHGGRARAFCAGSDINEFAHLRSDASEHKILFEDMVLRRLAGLPMPTIAAIDGPALGGGLELALACDLRVARAGIALGVTESRLGGLAGSGSVRLTHLIGPARAKQMLFTGETLDSDQALAWGLVNRVARSGSALDGARELAATIAARGPLSNRYAKELVAAALDLPLDAALSRANVLQQQIFDGSDLHEGVAAFFARRPPEFKGR